MSIARVSLVEFYDEKGIKNFETLYSQHINEFLPDLEQVINIKIGPTFTISVALYPFFQEAETNLAGRAKMVELMKPLIKEEFYHEGEITRNEIKHRQQIS